jgi:hypothetical protein
MRRPPTEAGSRPETSTTTIREHGLPGDKVFTTVTTAQATLDQYIEEQTVRARDAGFRSAEYGDPDYCRDVAKWIENLPAGYRFDADTIHSCFGASMASGSVVNSAARRGLIEHVGWTKSKAITRHGSDIKVWRRT